LCLTYFTCHLWCNCVLLKIAPLHVQLVVTYNKRKSVLLFKLLIIGCKGLCWMRDVLFVLLVHTLQNALYQLPKNVSAILNSSDSVYCVHCTAGALSALFRFSFVDICAVFKIGLIYGEWMIWKLFYHQLLWKYIFVSFILSYMNWDRHYSLSVHLLCLA
jgi:hypothetical protein